MTGPMSPADEAQLEACFVKMWLIEDTSSGVPTYYSARIARNHGGGMGWTMDREEASTFSSQELALSFAEMHMPTLQVNVVPWERKAK